MEFLVDRVVLPFEMVKPIICVPHMLSQFVCKFFGNHASLSGAPWSLVCLMNFTKADSTAGAFPMQDFLPELEPTSVFHGTAAILSKLAFSSSVCWQPHLGETLGFGEEQAPNRLDKIFEALTFGREL